ncbi:MAG: copper amine oxidase N-terminal domain-containing protein [Armatimonadota bacterium]
MSWKSSAKVLVFLMGVGVIGVGLIMPGLNAAPAVGAPGMAPMTTSATKAGDLRVALNNLLGEHVVFAASATSGALSGRTAQFNAAAAALDANSNDIIKAVAGVYGEDAGRAFGPLWKKHIGFVVDYTTGLAAKDKAKQDKAVNDLLAYTQEFGAFLNSATRGALPTAAVAELVKMHVLTLKDIIDAQAADQPGREFAAIRRAYGHMGMVAEPLAGAISRQFASRFPGSVDSSAVNLRIAYNSLLAEHVYLAARATGAALGGRQPEFRAAAVALDANSNDIIAAVGSIYGQDAGRAFGPLWKKHIGFVVDYTTGLATSDYPKRDKAVNDLLAYTQEFGAFLNSATRGALPTAAVAELVKMHVLTLKDVIDAQAAGNTPKVYTDLRKAMGHMQMLADPLTEAIVKQFAERYAQ